MTQTHKLEVITRTLKDLRANAAQQLADGVALTSANCQGFFDLLDYCIEIGADADNS